MTYPFISVCFHHSVKLSTYLKTNLYQNSSDHAPDVVLTPGSLTLCLICLKNTHLVDNWKDNSMQPTEKLCSERRIKTLTISTFCPDCGHFIRFHTDLNTRHDQTQLSIYGKCNCGFSWQKYYENCKGWTPAAIYRVLINVQRAFVANINNERKPSACGGA